MSVTVRPYPNSQKNFWAGSIDWDAYAIHVALLNSSGTFDDTHEFLSSVIANEVSGTGYTPGGVALASKTNVKTDSSALTAWAAATAYVAGDVRRAVVDNGHVFRCTAGGTSHATTEPTWVIGTLRETVEATGTVRWVEFGAGIVVLSAANPSWGPGATITGIRYGVVYERNSGTDATRQLIAHLDFGQTEQVTNGTFTITIPASGILRTGLGSPT